MPMIDVHLIEGYDADAKSRLALAITGAVRQIVPATPDLVTVVIRDMPPQNYFRGGENRTPAPARKDAIGIVQSYLSAMEARDLNTATALLGEGFTMYFPASGPMHSLAQLIEWAKPRYKFVTKTYDGYDQMQSAMGDATVVYCRGTLEGEYHDGRSFSGIRFIDRFEVTADKITKQEVWNDMAETQAKEGAA